MNKTQLTEALAAKLDVPKAEAKTILEGFQSVVTDAVKSGDPVLMTGFVKFARVERAARQGRNPATGEAIQIAAKTTVRVTPLKAFKDEVMAGPAKKSKDKKEKASSDKPSKKKKGKKK